MKRLTQTEHFELKGEWWRLEGAQLVKEFSEAPTQTVVGLEQGFARAQSERDRLEGSDREHACRGPLRFDPDSGLRLSLLGSSEIAFPSEEESFSVLGMLANGVPCSLLDCLVTRSQSHFPGGFADREILCHTLLCGVHVGSLGEFLVDHLVVRIPGLLEFLWAPVHAPDGAAHGGLGRGDANEDVVRFQDAELRFSVREKHSGTTHAATRERDAAVEVTLKTPIPFDQWLARWLEPLVRLVTLATRRPTVASSVYALLPTDSTEVEGPVPQARQQQVMVVQPQRRLRRAPILRWERMLTSHAALGDDFASLVTGWWDIHGRLAGAGDFLFGALRDPMGLEPQLITLTSVVEGYHRAFHDRVAVDPDTHARVTTRMLDGVHDKETRNHYSRRLQYANQLTQHDRVLAVFRRAGWVVEPLANKAGRLAEVIIATRNYFIHLEGKTSRVVEGPTLYEVNQLLILAINCNLLLDLGMSPEQARAGVERSYLGERFLRDLMRRGCAWPKLSS